MRRALILLVACQRQVPAPPPPPAPKPPAVTTTFDQQIAQLATTDAAGIGFSPSVTGTEFLPVPTTDDQGMLLLGQPAPERSQVLTKLVAGGAAAIPALVR